MKRLLQAASVVLLLLAVVLGLRIVRTLQVAPPELNEPPQVASAAPLPAPARNPTPRGAARDTIVTGNLFETERGYKAEDELSGDDSEEPPLPPPTNVVLNGVFVSRDKPMAILTDSSSGNHQLTLHVGDNVGDYQVGKITARQVTLIGRGNQEFLLELAIKKGGAAPVRNTAAARGARPAAAGRPGATPTAAQRAQAARERAAAARERAQQARAQTPAQRAAAARAAARAQPDKGSLGGRAAGGGVDPTQARLEALKRLREAAAKR